MLKEYTVPKYHCTTKEISHKVDGTHEFVAAPHGPHKPQDADDDYKTEWVPCFARGGEPTLPLSPAKQFPLKTA